MEKTDKQIELMIGKIAMVSINCDTNNGILNRTSYIGAVLEYNPYKNIVMDVRRVYIRDEKNIFPLPEREKKTDMVASLPFVGYGQYIDSITIAKENNNEYVIDQNYIYRASEKVKNVDGDDRDIIRNIRLNNLPEGEFFDNSLEGSKPVFYTNQEYYAKEPEKLNNVCKAYQKAIRRIA